MTDYEKLEERRQMARSNYYAQMAMMGYGSDGNALDLVKVVRCRDCKYWNETIGGCGECERLEVIDSNPEIIHAHQTPWDWYCADGERMDDHALD